MPVSRPAAKPTETAERVVSAFEPRRTTSKAHVECSAVSAARRLTGTRGVRRLMQVTPTIATSKSTTIIPTRGSRRSGDRSSLGSRRSGDRSSLASRPDGDRCHKTLRIRCSLPRLREIRAWRRKLCASERLDLDHWRLCGLRCLRLERGGVCRCGSTDACARRPRRGLPIEE